ncbi:MAG: 1-phosphofructokinase family hexose kinase [Candidatus Omnitrophota bacterium]
MRKYILTVTLNPAIDKTARVDRLRLGRDHREEELHVSAGGKGVNVSRSLAILGEPTLATGIVGGHTGKYLIAQLTKEGIRNDFLETEGETRVNLTVIDSSSYAITRIIERGVPVTQKIFAAFKEKYKKLVQRASYVVFCGANAYGLDDRAYGELIAIAHRADVATALDTRGESLIAGLASKPFMVKPNIEEAGYIVGEKLTTLSKIKKAARSIAEQGVQIVLITMGSRGALAYNGKEVIYAAPGALTCVNHVGCGDAFLAGFISSHKSRLSFKDSLRRAVAVGSASALTKQPGDFRMNDAKEIFAKIRVNTRLCA